MLNLTCPHAEILQIWDGQGQKNAEKWPFLFYKAPYSELIHPTKEMLREGPTVNPRALTTRIQLQDLLLELDSVYMRDEIVQWVSALSTVDLSRTVNKPL